MLLFPLRLHKCKVLRRCVSAVWVQKASVFRRQLAATPVVHFNGPPRQPRPSKLHLMRKIALS